MHHCHHMHVEVAQDSRISWGVGFLSVSRAHHIGKDSGRIADEVRILEIPSRAGSGIGKALSGSAGSGCCVRII